VTIIYISVMAMHLRGTDYKHENPGVDRYFMGRDLNRGSPNAKQEFKPLHLDVQRIDVYTTVATR
jgi:hypothetical protein